MWTLNPPFLWWVEKATGPAILLYRLTTGIHWLEHVSDMIAAETSLVELKELCRLMLAFLPLIVKHIFEASRSKGLYCGNWVRILIASFYVCWWDDLLWGFRMFVCHFVSSCFVGLAWQACRVARQLPRSSPHGALKFKTISFWKIE